MKKPGILFKILLYLSVPFIVYFLYKFNFLRFSGIQINYFWLVISIILGWSGFILSSLSWKYALNLHSINITVRLAIVSHGLSIFAKYIPGKIWVILGRASYITKNDISLKDASFVSLKEQLVFILVGFVVSFLPILWYFSLNYIVLVLAITILGLSLLVFNQYIHTLIEKVFALFFKREFVFPKISVALAGKLSGFILIYWLIWAIGYYALIRALSPEAALISAFAFPLSVCYGLLAIIIPGGLGVREGIMIAYLTLTGMEPSMAVTVSVVSRLWFITGELFIFITAVMGSKKERQLGQKSRKQNI